VGQAGDGPVGQGGVQTLLVAGGGGHLEELWLLRPRLRGITEEVTWAVPDTPETRKLLGDEARIDIPRCDPRDVKGTIATVGRAVATIRRRRWREIVSTGAIPAVPFFSVARAMGIPCHFIESAARVGGRSLTARIVDHMPGIHRYGQYEWWDRGGWSFRGSVFDGFVARPRQVPEIRRVVVTVGASTYGFKRLVSALTGVLPADAEVVWQVGRTDVEGLGIEARVTLPPDELFARMRDADLVVAHAGVGSTIMALQAGKCPVLVPRRSAHGEHVDDHQVAFAASVARPGLAVTAEVDELGATVLSSAAARTILRNENPPTFVLSAS
jgi:UDP-N-acetylglucosamine--N-acetylmuramyl-(pentapeptide) pyrophosphoryl-undecaprenol N-acetylglucosamine transferase